MYHDHWGLDRSPFRDGIDPRCAYRSPSQHEALARMQYLVEQQRRLGLILGEAGTGKTLLLSTFAEQQQRSRYSVGSADLLGCDTTAMLWKIAADWGLCPSPNPNAGVLWRRIEDRLHATRCEQRGCILLFDEADSATSDVLAAVLRLSNVADATQAALTILLATRPEAVSNLGPRLLDLASLRIDLESWDEADTGEYLDRTLSEAGREIPAFDEEAVAHLRKLAGGTPRNVAKLADLGLLAGAGGGLDFVDPETLESANDELCPKFEKAQRKPA